MAKNGVNWRQQSRVRFEKSGQNFAEVRLLVLILILWLGFAFIFIKPEWWAKHDWYYTWLPWTNKLYIGQTIFQLARCGYTQSKAGFPLGEFVRANRERSNLIGWRQTLTSSPANHVRFLLVRANKFAKWKTGLTPAKNQTPEFNTTTRIQYVPNLIA